mmetsp:Transcript_8496/g.25661  ORF Transcript_8496/g.25661 Transcript_8496/m.25661 type:complete len:89 (-) Transcript_8496:380-646(-)
MRPLQAEERLGAMRGVRYWGGQCDQLIATRDIGQGKVRIHYSLHFSSKHAIKTATMPMNIFNDDIWDNEHISLRQKPARHTAPKASQA